MPDVDPQVRWELLVELFRSAAGLDATARARYLAAECAADPALRSEIESLLLHHDAPPSPLDAPALGVEFKPTLGIVQLAAGPTLEPGRLIGRYRVKRLVGRGGMSAVYEADQESPARPVALKVLCAGPRPGQRLVQRLRDEGAILARLRHEGIAQVYDVGLHDEDAERIAYIAMEYLPDAAPVTDHARARRLDTRACAELVARVCDAVHHAHQRGVIHRDLKPSNILVDADARAKVIDFGVALLLHADPGGISLPREIVGTPAYMSPEQLSPHGAAPDVRSDVYALGVVLLELLGGKPGRADPAEGLSQAKWPDQPITADVRHVLRRALDHDPDRRYQSAAELADDLRRFLQYRPLRARRATLAYRMTLASRRNPTAAAATGALFVALLVGVGLIAHWAAVATREHRAAQQAVAFFDTMLASAHERRTGDEVRVTDLLAHARDMLDERHDLPPEVESRLRDTIGRAYESLADYAAALKQYKRSLLLAEESLGADHPFTARVRIELAGSLYDRGDFQGAAAMLEHLLLRHEPHGATRTLISAKMRNDLGITYLNLDRPADARRELIQALDARRRLLGPRHRDCAQTMYNLGVAHVLLSQHRDAEPLFRDSLDVYAGQGPEVRGAASAAKRFLALCLLRRNDSQAAVALADDAVADARASQGERHPVYAAALAARAEVAQALGDPQHAVELFNHAAAIYRNRLGKDHRRTREAEAGAAAALELLPPPKPAPRRAE